MSLEQAIRNLRLQIPAPARPRARPAKSWRQLRPTQRLVSLVDITIGGRRIPADSLWAVHSVDSNEAILEHDAGSLKVMFHLEDPEWKGRLFKRAGSRGRRSRTRKKEPSK